MTRLSITTLQIQWLRQLSASSKSDIEVMLKPQSQWFGLFEVIENIPDRPIHSRSILRDELVLEIDDANWTVVRDGTRKIIAQLVKWGADGSYYLSFSGNHSIHVHVFMDLKTLGIQPETSQILRLLEQGAVNSAVKSYITHQFAIATDTQIDPQLTGKHLIRMEGGFNEKSHKFCTFIDAVPEEKPMFYEILIPTELPPKQWNISFLEAEINAYLQIHFKPKPEFHFCSRGEPINPENIPEILKPVYIEGYRHFIVMSLSGWLWRHHVPMEKCKEVIKQLNPRDKTPSKTMATVHGIYKSREGDKVPGFHKLASIIQTEVLHGKITPEVGESTILGLKKIIREGTRE